MSKILIDTNAYSNLLRGNQTVFGKLSQASTVFVSVIVLGELYAGFKGGTRETYNVKLLNKFLSQSNVKVLDVSLQTAEIFGELKHKLKIKGTPVPINDLWIAAHSVETGSLLISFDQHFEVMDGLRFFFCEGE